MLTPSSFPLSNTVPKRVKMLPLALYMNVALLSVTGCAPADTEAQSASPRPTESTLEAPKAMYEVQATEAQREFARATTVQLLEAMRKTDATLDIVLPTMAHLALPADTTEPVSLQTQKWLYALREQYGFDRYSKSKTMEEADALLSLTQKDTFVRDDVAFRLVALLLQIRILERK